MLKLRFIKMRESERSLLEILGWHVETDEPEPQYAPAQETEQEGGPPTSQDGMMEFRCACGKLIKTSVKNAGMNARCPACKKMIQIPMNEN